MKQSYTVVVMPEKDGRYSVTVPALNDCATIGETLPEALRMAEEAILAYLDGLQALGEPLPSDAQAVTIDLGEAAEASVYRLTVQQEAPVP